MFKLVFIINFVEKFNNMAVEKVFKISDEQIKEMYLSGSSLNDIAKVAQDTKGLMALRRKLHILGVDTNVSQKKYRYKISKASKKYTLNEHIFDNIDTEEKAYWLGFLMADGYNHESKSCVALRLQVGDREILEKYKKFLETDTPIYTFTRTTLVNKLIRQYCELTICSPYFSEQLARLGCIQGKTYTLEFPNIPESLYSHFIRGYFDGDGCLSVRNRLSRRKSHGKSMSYQFTIVGRESVLLKIQDILVNNLNIPRISLRERLNSPVKTIHYSGKNVVTKIMNYIYKDATIYLERKYNLYLKYCISAE